MNDVERYEAVQQLHCAWRDAALGNPNSAEEHIREALDALEQVVAQRPRSKAGALRGYIEDARAAVMRSDSLGMILATVAALQELESE